MDRADYPIWHGSSPMGPFLRNKLSAGRLLVEGTGTSVRDADGNWFLDARGGLWNMSLGYSADEVKRAITAQLERLPFGTLLSYDRPPKVTVDYALRLRESFPQLPWVRFGNSGSQMTETAVLVSRLCHQINRESRDEIISFEGSYHGMGPGASALSGILTDFVNADTFLSGISHLPAVAGEFPATLADHLSRNSAGRVAAVIIEPQMGSSGVVLTADDIRGIADICRRNGIHLIADEVSTGFGRTGAMSQCVSVGVVPDMIVLGKNLTSGYVPIGALMISGELYESAFDPDPVRILAAGSTTDGHPLAAAAGLAVLAYYQQHNLLEHVAKTGTYLRDRLTELSARFAPAGDVAGEGLMQRLGLRHDDSSAWTPAETEELRLACEAHGLLISRGTGCIWTVPPLIADEGCCDDISQRLGSALEDVRRSRG